MIGHGSTSRQVVAIADSIEERLASALKRSPRSIEGRRLGEWVLLDYLDFVVHVFVEERREFYSLERLWGDAPRLDVDEGGVASPDPGREPRRTRRGKPSVAS